MIGGRGETCRRIGACGIGGTRSRAIRRRTSGEHAFADFAKRSATCRRRNGNSYDLSFRQKQSNSAIKLSGFYSLFISGPSRFAQV